MFDKMSAPTVAASLQPSACLSSFLFLLQIFSPYGTATFRVPFENRILKHLLGTIIIERFLILQQSISNFISRP